MIFEFDIQGKGVAWLPGQHGIFILPRKGIVGRRWRAFSVSSIPEEGILQIATKMHSMASSFKQALALLKPGEHITIRGPYGWLYFKDDVSPVVMIAGGIGITPFRALFKELECGNTRDITLIYAGGGGHLFRDELDAVAAQDSQIKIVYTYAKEETASAIQMALSSRKDGTYYFVSGAPAMIQDIQQTLRAAAVPSERIVTDPFRGY
jgi:ferredoxin-NADP reductase